MITVPETWIAKHRERLAPEGYVELSYLITEEGLQEDATASATDQAAFSDIADVTNPSANRPTPRYATFEWNHWQLDGTGAIVDGVGTNDNAGYVSAAFCEDAEPLLTVSLSQVHTQPIQGVTIVWSEEYDEFPVSFTVTAYRGSSVVAEADITDNRGNTSTVELDLVNYDSVVIKVREWCLPLHRARIEQVMLGTYITYTKRDLMQYSHEQTGCLMSGELPKNSISFALDNSTGVWNPLNPDGYTKYLAERQQIKVRYGFNIDGNIEWIKAGTFYLSEWSTPANSITATFTARDILEFAMEVPYTGDMSGTLYDIVLQAVNEANFPYGASVYIDDSLKDVEAGFEGEYTVAQIIQMAANAGTCVMYQDREGVFRIEKAKALLSDYRISQNVSYSFPEIELSKPLKAVNVSFGAEANYIHAVGSSGETQTVDNPIISSEETAKRVAEWTANVLSERQTLSGSFRADPRLDLYDKIAVESKYGVSNAVFVTSIKYEFTGAFKGSYTGRQTIFEPVIAGYCGEFYAGDV